MAPMKRGAEKTTVLAYSERSGQASIKHSLDDVAHQAVGGLLLTVGRLNVAIMHLCEAIDRQTQLLKAIDKRLKKERR